MMAKLIFALIMTFICGIIVGFCVWAAILTKRTADGTCMRADDGEVYMKISELGQKKLADPETSLLLLKVIDVSTRNKHSI